MAANSSAGQSPVGRPSIVPPVVVQPGVESLDSPVAISEDTVFQVPSFAKATMDRQGRRMPQCIAHRGYKAKYPENTLLAFEEALKAGAKAIETDVHLTKDDVVVLSHDQTLKRCFGKKDRVLESNWDDIKNLRTLAPPHVPMPRLLDLLEYLTQPGLEDVWVLLDIKLDNQADDVMRLIASTINSVKPSPERPWKDRIVLGIWAAKYLALAERHLLGFSVMHIGYKISYARQFESVPNVGFNLMVHMLMAPGGKGFIHDCQQKLHRQLLAWTVNEKDKMEWCIRRRVDGVITDDPSLFNSVCQRYDELAKEPLIPVGFRTILDVLRIYILVMAFFWLFRRRVKDSDLIRKVRKE
ncbi:related to glycerophosphoryl diester phosphodiesterase family [Lecanosticta acicola]|uniref:Related to glycerophosphoryl diester phosphodiesterase family n=1 Tax=Lecanosticta acicola TaxID=111012 RepID=A0AAI8Z826_9PEZI|nr:related to glycerophosphoryl diester phosphodiesterase family [Lecanosticta acicola]